MAGLQLNNIYKRYGNGAIIVNDFNLKIKDKEFIVLVGPSGCGKSTTLRMIAGLEDITDGELWIGDRLVNDIAPKDRDIAMVFQSYALYPHMTVYENMAFGLKLRNFKPAEIDLRVREAAQILDISHLLERKPKALSGGQRQRVALGRAIVREPQVFLMDEPLSNLDAKLRVQMRAEISKLHKRLQTTIIYVTHDQIEAMTMGDRIVVMKDGIVQQADTPDNIYTYPHNIFVAGFIGSPAMNFISGVVTNQTGKVTFRANGIDLVMPDGKARALIEKGLVNSEVILGIRPEHILDDADYIRANPGSVIYTQIDVKENLGAEVYLYLTGVGTEPVVARINPRQGLEEGSSISLAIDTDKVHLFDKDSQRAILGPEHYGLSK